MKKCSILDCKNKAKHIFVLTSDIEITDSIEICDYHREMKLTHDGKVVD